jgi:hypothetical protein
MFINCKAIPSRRELLVTSEDVAINEKDEKWKNCRTSESYIYIQEGIKFQVLEKGRTSRKPS